MEEAQILMNEFEFESDEEIYNVRGPSKSSRKRQSHGLQDLGEELMALSRQQLEALDLPENLLEAVVVGQGIKAHGGLLRQRKYIGKILRALDPAPIHEGLAALRGETVALIRLQHQSEHWRDRMLEEGDAGVNVFVGAYSSADRQKLRQLVREAKREKEREAPPKSARLLFKEIRAILGAVLDADDSTVLESAD
jgi:ribosome-associated protein